MQERDHNSFQIDLEEDEAHFNTISESLCSDVEGIEIGNDIVRAVDSISSHSLTNSWSSLDSEIEYYG